MCLKVFGKKFEANGASKKIARFRAAESAMQQLFGFEYDENYSKCQLNIFKAEILEENVHIHIF